MLPLVFFLILGLIVALAYSSAGPPDGRSHLREFIYSEGFEAGELNAWSSYPPNQDTAYNPYIYPGKVRPEDAGKCLVIKLEPQWNEDQLLGAIKLLDLVLGCQFLFISHRNPFPARYCSMYEKSLTMIAFRRGLPRRVLVFSKICLLINPNPASARSGPSELRTVTSTCSRKRCWLAFKSLSNSSLSLAVITP